MKNFLFCISVLCAGLLFGGSAIAFCNDDIPLKKITLYSSGVAHYEHSGNVSGSGKIDLLFSAEQINDVLKSLLINDPAAQTVSIDYQAGNTAEKALESLKVNPAAVGSLLELLHLQQGAEIEVYTPNKITGKILSVESIPANIKKQTNNSAGTPQLTLLSEGKVHLLSFSDIQSFRFTDESRNTDLNTALTIMLNTASINRKQLSVNIESKKNREISFSYIMEAPVWKASYRLDTAQDEAALQAWAIVDNSSDLDWKNITLTLTTGRPIAFKQNLYEPYYTDRPTVPLLIAQTAVPKTFESGYTGSQMNEPQAMEYSSMKRSAMRNNRIALEDAAEESSESGYFENQVTVGDIGGNLCTFTPVQPVTLERQKSTMIPLMSAAIPAEKVSVFSDIQSGVLMHPKFCISIHNTSSYKLPAGPVTVFDKGTYVGDAILQFLPDGEKRLLAYGDDLEVQGMASSKHIQDIESVKIGGGMVTVFSKRINETQYVLKNASNTPRSIVIEHPIQSAYTLVSKKNLIEKTAQQYRFKFETAAGAETQFVIQEERILQNTQNLLHTNDDFFISLTANTKLPEEVKKQFTAILKERQKVQTLHSSLKQLQNEQKKRISEQERTRKNLEAFGKETQQGREFITKLLKLEEELETLSIKIDQTEKALNIAETDFSSYLNNITL